MGQLRAPYFNSASTSRFIARICKHPSEQVTSAGTQMPEEPSSWLQRHLPGRLSLHGELIYVHQSQLHSALVFARKIHAKHGYPVAMALRGACWPSGTVDESQCTVPLPGPQAASSRDWPMHHLRAPLICVWRPFGPAWRGTKPCILSTAAPCAPAAMPSCISWPL